MTCPTRLRTRRGARPESRQNVPAVEGVDSTVLVCIAVQTILSVNVVGREEGVIIQINIAIFVDVAQRTALRIDPARRAKV